MYNMLNTELIKKFNYELLVFENEYNPQTSGAVTADLKPTFREYQTNLLIKINDYLYLFPNCYNDLFVYYEETQNANDLDELYTINRDVDILVENC